MAVSRGLNKGRGLGALIPQKKRQEKAAEPEKVDITSKEEKADADKKAAPADKKPAAQKEAVESSLVLLEEGICYDQCVLLAKLY